MHAKLTLGIVAMCALAIAAGVIYAERPSAIGLLKTSVDAEPFAGPVPDVLPPVERGEMTTTADARALVLLQYDDGSCESGLGGGTWSSLVDWDLPTYCGVTTNFVVGLSAKINTNTAWSFVMYQAGAAPGNGRFATAISPMAGTGPCPTAQTIQTRAIGPGVAVVTGTANFYAGVYGNCYPGRDTGTSHGRMWIATTGGGGYSPTYLASIGYGGNWVIRITIEENCWPVELQGFTIK